MKSLHEYYAIQMPEYKWKVDQWKISLRKIEQQFGVNVLWHQSVNLAQCHGEPPPLEETASYAEMLLSELDLYQFSALKQIGVESIVLCGSMINIDREVLGFSHGDLLLFNTSSDLSSIDKRKTIHHEIFHSIERLLGLGYFKEWNALPKIDGFSSKPPGEYRADMFACMVLDQDYLNQISDSVVSAKQQMIADAIEKMEGFGSFFDRCKKRRYHGASVIRWATTDMYLAENMAKARILQRQQDMGSCF